MRIVEFFNKQTFSFSPKIKIKTIYVSILMHPVWVLYLARCTFWLSSTWVMGKMTEDDKGGGRFILSQILADTIC